MRRIIPILSFILFAVLNSQGQTNRNTPNPESTERIIKLYPNPAQSYITFDLQKSTEKGLSIQVFNFLGKKMYESSGINEKLTVDLAEYNRGVYIYHLRDISGKVIESGKFQVSR